MKHVIKRGTHYARPLNLFDKLFSVGKCSADAIVKFGESCRYDIGKDQTDINKLFGISFGYHHTNSARIGWRYVPKFDKIELTTYCYVNGERIKEKSLGFVEFGKTYSVQILSTTDLVRFVLDGSVRAEEKVPSSGISYPLSLYFGGNYYAPHNMYIDLNVNWK